MKPRSGLVTDGLERAPARGMLRAVGMTDEDWVKPQIGIASSWNEITPCNLSLDRLAKASRKGVIEAAADFVICRAGAVTCAELLAVGVPALLVPLEIGNGEQQENAKVLIDKSQAQVVPNREFTKLWAEENLIDILKNAPARFAGISKRADETIGVRALDLIRLSRS